MSIYRGKTAKEFYLAYLLYDSIEDENLCAVKSLITTKGADATIVLPKKGMAPFHLVVGKNSMKFAVEVTKLILEQGANPNIQSEDGLTPLHIAAAWGHAEIVKLLLLFGADPGMTDNNYNCALDYAQKENYKNIVDMMKPYMTHPCQMLNRDDVPAYETVLESICVEDGTIVCEYTFGDKHIKKPTLSETLPLLPGPNTEEFVRNWCNSQNNIVNTSISSLDCKDKPADHFDSLGSSLKDSEETSLKLRNFDNITVREDRIWPSFANIDKSRRISRESGILTLPDSALDIAEEIKDLKVSENYELQKNKSSSDYSTCYSNSLPLEQNLVNITSNKSTNGYYNNSTIENLSCTNRMPTEISNVEKQDDTSDLSFITVSEVYMYKDDEEGVVLLEKRLLKNPNRESINNEILSKESSRSPVEVEYDNDTLRRELTLLGYSPGPITATTKLVYLKKLYSLKRSQTPILPTASERVYSVELQKTFRNTDWLDDLTLFRELEETMINTFHNPDPSRKWREGTKKMSFTYLLLDPRITNNLPAREKELSFSEKWTTFIDSIFYIGKGKLSRPYSHLYEAFYLHRRKKFDTDCKKLRHILNIWQDEYGVICLQVFHNVIAEEAFTREAAMISALKVQNLCNKKSGEFYRRCATWPERQKRQLGVYLLYKAMNIFLHEGERQLCPSSILY